MKTCTCCLPHKGIAVISPCFAPWHDGEPKDWEILFVNENAGKLVCFYCGGQVPDEYYGHADRVTATAIIERLHYLGVI